MRTILLTLLPLASSAFTASSSVKYQLQRCTFPRRRVNSGYVMGGDNPSSSSSSLLAADGSAPQYEKFDATLKQAETVAEGSVMLHIDTNGVPFDYKPGHVLALEIEGNKIAGINNKKNAEDTAQNGGWMRGPYTVSRTSTNSLDVLIKVVGDKSKVFASAESGTPLKFGGKFKVPIIDGINKEETKRVVLISTGVGVGPCVGAIEEALFKDDSSNKFPPIELYACYRNRNEIIYEDYLNDLALKYPNQFKWRSIISSETGRLSSTKENIQLVLSNDGVEAIDDTHFHLIGNGQMVNEWKEGLTKGGIIPEDKVTIEMYFNHKVNASKDAISMISNEVLSMSRNECRQDATSTIR